MKKSKRVREASAKVDRNKAYEVREAVDLLKECPSPKFDETVEICFKLGVDPRHADQMVRGSFSLPKGIGKSMRVVVFAEGEAAEQAREAGAIEVGGQDLVQKIEGGFLDFDVAIASPDMMRYVGRLGRLLGPKGLMPSPKSGTVTPDVAQAVTEFAAGKVEFRTDSSGNVHLPVGKKSFSGDDLQANVDSFVEHIQSIKPAAAKGKYIEKVVLSSSMGPGIKLAVG